MKNALLVLFLMVGAPTYAQLLQGSGSSAQNLQTLQQAFTRTVDRKDYDSAAIWNERIRVYNHAHALGQFHTNSGLVLVKKRHLDSLGPHLAYLSKTYGKASDSTSLFFMGRHWELSGFARFYKNDLDGALSDLDRAIDCYYKCSNWEKARYTLNMMGTMAYINSEPERAAGYLFRSLEVFSKNPNDSSAYADILVDLANVYTQLEQFEKAGGYLESALRIKSIQEDTRADILTNLASVKIHLEKSQEGIALLKESMEIYERLDDTHNLSVVYCNLGTTLGELPTPDPQAKYYLRKALDVAPRNGYSSIHASASLGLVKFFLVNNGLDSAAYFLRQTEDYLVDSRDIEQQAVLFQYKARLAAKQGDFERAYTFEMEHKRLSDSILSSRRLAELTQQEKDYAARNEENKIRLLQQETLIKDLNLSRTRLTNAIILMLIVILVIAAGVLFFLQQNRFKKQIDTMTARQNNELSKAIIKGEEEERNRIARDLHDGVGNTLALVKTIVSDKGYKDVQDLINQAHDEVREVAHNLMPGVLLRFGINDALKELSVQWQKTRQVSFDLSISLDEGAMPIDQKVTLYRIIQELIKNAMTRGMADLIIVEIKAKGSSIIARVEDNGKGFDTTTATAGLGMQNINNRVFYLGGTLHVESGDDGSTFTFTFPMRTETS